MLDRTSLKVFAKFEEIHAFQLLTERHTGNEGGYYSFELNLVLINGKRINVIDHGNKESIREDAIVLSAFMDKPVWDAM